MNMDIRDKIAFFDFDGTLIRSDSFIKFVQFTVGKRRFAFALVKSMPWIFCWKVGLKSGGWAKEHLFCSLFKGMNHAEWMKKCRDFTSQLIADQRDGIISILRKHQSEGHQIVIVTASPVDWVRPWAEAIGINQVIGTEIEVDRNGLLTGCFSSPNCHGPEKVRRVKEAFPALSSFESWAYGDSKSDRFLLSLTTHPRFV